MLNKKEINSLSLDDMKKVLKEITIIQKIEYSKISKEEIKAKIKDLRIRQVPERTVFLEADPEEIVFYWFKNWLHPKLKHIVEKSPRSKVGCSQRVIENDMKRDYFNFYENGQQNYKYTLKEIEEWLK